MTYNETYILSIWSEVLLYGLYLSLFSTSFYIVMKRKSHRTVSNRVMFVTMIMMFVLGTIHVGTNLFRMLEGYVWRRYPHGEPSAYFSNFAIWHHVFKDAIYATQTIIGDGLAIYRCWIVWGNNYHVVALPLLLLIVSMVSMCIISWMFARMGSNNVFDIRLRRWITVFYAIAVAQNLMTTGLIAFKIWRCERGLAVALNTRRRSTLFPILRIIIESAAIYAAAQTVLLILYSLNVKAQTILLETITPTVGIVFTSITVRLALRSGGLEPTSVVTTTTGTAGPIIVPMRPLAVHVMRSVHTTFEPVDDIGINEDSNCESCPENA